jgi:hypothetical protein
MNSMAIFEKKILHSTYKCLYSMGLLTSSYMERMFASTNFLRGVSNITSHHFTHVNEFTWRGGIEPPLGFAKFYRTLFFYNPIMLVFNLKCLATYIIELSSIYGNVLYINTAQYNLSIHYMMRWYSRLAAHSCIGTVWQGGTLSAMNTRFLLVRRCLALPYQAFSHKVLRWNIAFVQIITLVRILRQFFYKYEFYGRIRKEINKIRKIFKMFYYYRYIHCYSHLDSVLLMEPVYRRSYRMIREVNNFDAPAIGSCSISNTALWYDYWLPMDSVISSSCIFSAAFVSGSAQVGIKLRSVSLFLKNAKYGKYC